MSQSRSLDDRTLKVSMVALPQGETLTFRQVFESMRDGVQDGMNEHDATYTVSSVQTNTGTVGTNRDKTKFKLNLTFDECNVAGIPLAREIEDSIKNHATRCVKALDDVSEVKHAAVSLK